MAQPHAETCALITGGSQGLGLAIARRLVAEGCRNLVLAGRDAEKGAAAAAGLGDDVAAHFLAVDMADAAAAIAMVDDAAERMGRVNALVNGAANTARGSILDTTPQGWDAVMAPNAKGPFFALQRFANRAIAAGHAAAAVNVLSIVVHGGLPFLAGYSASKAALANITKNAANTLAAHRIRVNGINVGWMDTPGEDAVQRRYHGAGDGWLAEAEARMPFGMLVKPDHVAGLASYLLGPEAGVMTGALIDFDQQVIGVYPDTHP